MAIIDDGIGLIQRLITPFVRQDDTTSADVLDTLRQHLEFDSTSGVITIQRPKAPEPNLLDEDFWQIVDATDAAIAQTVRGSDGRDVAEIKAEIDTLLKE